MMIRSRKKVIRFIGYGSRNCNPSRWQQQQRQRKCKYFPFKCRMTTNQQAKRQSSACSKWANKIHPFINLVVEMPFFLLPLLQLACNRIPYLCLSTHKTWKYMPTTLLCVVHINNKPRRRKKIGNKYTYTNINVFKIIVAVAPPIHVSSKCEKSHK